MYSYLSLSNAGTFQKSRRSVKRWKNTVGKERKDVGNGGLDDRGGLRGIYRKKDKFWEGSIKIESKEGEGGTWAYWNG